MWYKNNMNLRARLAKLERRAPRPAKDNGWLIGVPDDVLKRVQEQMEAGTYPASLTCADIAALQEAVDAYYAAGGRI